MAGRQSYRKPCNPAYVNMLAAEFLRNAQRGRRR